MRADAARNRQALLAAAERLFDAAADPGQVSMDDIAAAAGVGKGTLFRRFGSRTGLILALFEERSSQLYGAFRAPHDDRAPEVRALEVLRAVLRFKAENRVVALAIDATDGNPYGNETYDRWHTLLAELVAEARGTENADFLAHALLAAIRSDLIAHLRDWPEERLDTGLATLVHAVVGQPVNHRPTPSR